VSQPDPHKYGSISVFFPMHNEEGNIEPQVQAALGVLQGYTDDFEVIVVDDGSTDRTGEIADRLQAENEGVRAVHHPTNRGYGGAVKSGFEAATKELVFFTDGDRQFDLNELGLLLERIEDHDVVLGFRIKRSDAFHRSVNTFLWHRLVRLLFGLRVRDIDCAFKLFRREVLERIGRLETEGAVLSTELLVKISRAGFRVAEVGVHHYPRPTGEQSGASLRVSARAFKELAGLRKRLGSARPPVIGAR